jgi:hypothetical protein
MASLICARCGASLPDPHASATIRCARCGAVHHVDGDVISPVMRPAFYSREAQLPDRVVRIPDVCYPRVSPWQLPHVRPVVGGFYEVRYQDGTECILWWDVCLRRFLAWNGQRVRGTVATWRGSWE